MLLKGIIWQNLRQAALDSIPEGTVAPFRAPLTIGQWLGTGAFTVSASTPKSITLTAAGVDIGAAICGQCSFLSDHAIEHSVTLRNQLASGKWHSSAWSIVSVYYWCFFLALQLTQLQGRTSLFLSRDVLFRLKTLSPTGQSP